ncbi:hypothetical protein EJB05_06820, partial [Eragrostis curvula]
MLPWSGQRNTASNKRKNKPDEGSRTGKKLDYREGDQERRPSKERIMMHATVYFAVASPTQQTSSETLKLFGFCMDFRCCREPHREDDSSCSTMETNTRWPNWRMETANRIKRKWNSSLSKFFGVPVTNSVTLV